jgi:hypothetical protein
MISTNSRLLDAGGALVATSGTTAAILSSRVSASSGVVEIGIDTN